MKKFTRICLAGFFAGVVCLLLSGILPLAEFPAQLLFGFGIALMILGFSNLVSQFVVSKTETEETVKVKRVEENDERNIRIRERAGFRTSQVILGVLFVHKTVGYKVPDEECDLDYCVDGNINMKINAALSNSLGFGGHNATICFKSVD